jgi:hypothetical protein
MKAPLLFLALAFAPRGASAMPASYATLDEAAVAFVDLVRSYPQQKNEYCTWLIRSPGPCASGRSTRAMNRCPGPRPTGRQVGTPHPIWGPGFGRRLGRTGVLGGILAEHSDVGVPTYLGAPAGHVLRYDPGGTSCWGKSFIARRFKIVRDLNPGVRGRLPLNPDEKTALYDAGGKPIPKPPYCKDAPRP